VFRRRRRQSETGPVEGGPVEDDADGVEVDPVDEEDRPAEPARPQGPWDVEDAPEDLRSGQRLDLGGIDVPVLPGLELRIDMDEAQRPVAATVVSGQSAMQVNAFAAPRTEGIWAEVRAEILASLQPGGAREVEGPWGTEVASKVPAGPPVPGRGTPVIDARFIGVDGPRWFLRGLISGPAATDPALAAPFEEVLRGVVVVRGGEAMPPRDPLPLVLPKQVQEAAAAQAEQQARQRTAQEEAQLQARVQAELQGADRPDAPAGPRASMADQLAAAARAVAARQAGAGASAAPVPGSSPAGAAAPAEGGGRTGDQASAPDPGVAQAPSGEGADSAAGPPDSGAGRHREG
jgi:hypothetical protein